MQWFSWLSIAVLAALPQAAAAQQSTGEERLFDAEVKPGGITFRVASGGCTRKANFGLETLAVSPLTLRLVRLRPDYCASRLPLGTQVTFTFAEIGQQSTMPGSLLHGIIIVNGRIGK